MFDVVNEQIEKYKKLSEKQKKEIYICMLKPYIDKVKVCEFCKSRKIKKNGNRKGIQCFQCNKCMKNFLITIVPPANKIMKFINRFIKNKKLEDISKELNISVQQLQRWKNIFYKEIDNIKF